MELCYNDIMHPIAQNIQQTIISSLPSRRKKASDWISFNAVCCHHNGESHDTRSRGGVMPGDDGAVTYHCFNCGFKSGFYPGRSLSYKFRKLMSWIGMDENTIQRLSMDALRLRDITPAEQHTPVPEVEVTFKARPLPDESCSFSEWATYATLQKEEWMFPKEFTNACDYIYERSHDLMGKYEFRWTPETSYNLNKRVIVPFYWKGKCIGYTARAWDDTVKPKYHSSYEANYVFNTNNQLADSKFVIVTEGPFDAMAVDGISVLSNEISTVQADIIDSLNREVIVLPDWDEPGKRMIDAAIEYGWSVAFPVWRDEFKDASEAVKKLGKLFVMQSILSSKESNPVKIQLRSRL